MAKGQASVPAPRLNINPLANVKVPLGTAINSLNLPKGVPAPVAPVIVVQTPKPLA